VPSIVPFSRIFEDAVYDIDVCAFPGVYDLGTKPVYCFCQLTFAMLQGAIQVATTADAMLDTMSPADAMLDTMSPINWPIHGPGPLAPSTASLPTPKRSTTAAPMPCTTAAPVVMTPRSASAAAFGATAASLVPTSLSSALEQRDAAGNCAAKAKRAGQGSAFAADRGSSGFTQQRSAMGRAAARTGAASQRQRGAAHAHSQLDIGSGIVDASNGAASTCHTADRNSDAASDASGHICAALSAQCERATSRSAKRRLTDSGEERAAKAHKFA
jgi:hypothetical protein